MRSSPPSRPYRIALALAAVFVLVLVATGSAAAHGVGDKDAAFIQNNPGAQVGPFLYLGAKHMVTGYDHLLFLVGVIFFLYRLRDVLLYVSMFTLGHSATLLAGVLFDIQANAYLIDAIIGLSIVYKGFDNLGGFQRILGRQPDTKAAVLIFGLFHGLGLATKLQDLALSDDGLLANLVSFNIGVEVGQFLALCFIVLLLDWWRRTPLFTRGAFTTNVLLMAGGFILIGYQLTGYFVGA